MIQTLLTLQDLIKKDSISYKDEFLEQYQHYQSMLEIYKLQPAQSCEKLVELVGFLSHVMHLYPEKCKQFPLELINLLESNGPSLPPELRLTLCKSLVLLRNRHLAPAHDVLRLFFQLLKCPDKELRKFIFHSEVSHLKVICLKKKNTKLNTILQNYIYSKVQDSSTVVARVALMMTVDLFRKNIWCDAKTANVIASACFVKSSKVMATALRFFLGREDEADNASETESEDEGRTLKDVVMAYRVAKKTKKRKRQMEKAKQALTKEKRKKKERKLGSNAIDLLYDPQEFCERLFKRLESSNDRFEFRLLMIGLIAKTIGTHKVILLNFYAFVQRYLQPKQREVTKVLLYIAQAAHELVPPETMEGVVRAIVNNFVTERNSAEVMTVGLNTVREICTSCPLAVGVDLLQDLTEYKRYKNKNVVMAARSLIQLYRTINPSALHRRDRGQPTEYTKALKPKAFGEVEVPSGVPGADCLPAEAAEKTVSSEDEGTSDEDGEDWVDIESDHAEELSERTDVEEENHIEAQTSSESSDHKAALVSSSRVLSQEEFRKIRTHQLAKHLQPSRKRKVQFDLPDDNDEEEEGARRNNGLPNLGDIEKLYKKPKQSKEERLASVQTGRDGREKFGRPKPKGPHVGRTNKKMKKRKPFEMVKHKQGRKKKRSFRDKQLALKHHIAAQQKLRR